MVNKGGRERSKICGIGINDLPYVVNKSELVNGKTCYVDRAFFNMPDILGWIEVPELEVE